MVRDFLKSVLFLTVFIIFSTNCAIDFARANSYRYVKVQDRSLLTDFDQNGVYEPYFIKGAGYSPFPIGRHPSDWGWPVGDGRINNILDDPSILQRDFTLIKNMNANTIRIWGGQDINQSDGRFPVKLTRQTLDLAQQNNIKVIAGFWINNIGETVCTPAGSQYNVYIDVTDPFVRNDFLSRFGNYVSTFKDHPAILFWAIGNENNLHLDSNSAVQQQAWFSLVNEMAQLAHQIEGANSHPVAVVNGDLGYIGDVNAGASDSQLASVDIWGSNVYRGQSFGTLFSEYATKSAKPFWIAEYGIDAWHTTDLNNPDSGQEDQNIQALWAENLWNEIVTNAQTAIGGTIMEYSDEWWKPYEWLCGATSGFCNSMQNHYGYGAVDSSCPKDGTYEWTPPSPDQYFNSEWHGVMEISAHPVDPRGLDIMTPRILYFNLQDRFAQGTGGSSVTSFTDDFNRTNGTFIGSSWNEAIGDFTITSSELVSSASKVNQIALLPALNGAQQSVSADFASTDNNLGPRLGMVLRYQNPQNYYLIYRNVGGSSVLRISRVVNGVEKILKSVSITNPGKNVLFRLGGSVDGSTLTLTLGGVLKATVQDTTFAQGMAGVYVGSYYAKSHRVDNVVANSSSNGVNLPPVANAGADKIVIAGTTVNFSGTASPSGSAFIYTWYFGDGTEGTGANVAHVYTVPGNYTVLLNVSDGKFNDTDSMLLTVSSNSPPVLNSIGQKTVSENQTLSFVISATDPENNPLTYSASSLPSGAQFNTSTRTFSWKPGFTQSGSYQAIFNVSDGTSTDSETITINVANVNRAPVANAGPNKTASAGQSVSLSGSASSDPDGDALTFSWNFGDGAPPGSGAGVSHAYASAGTYTATLTVSDGNLSTSDSAVVTVSAANNPPVLSSIGNKSVNENQALTFMISATDPNNNSLTYSASGLPSGAQFNTSTKTFSWTPGFTRAGTYNVTFGVSDGALTDSEAITITVANVNRAPVANAGADQTAASGVVLTFNGSASSDPDGTALTYSWNFGDGTPASSSVQVGHAFANAGSYTVTLTVSDGSLTHSDTASVTITPSGGGGNPPPTGYEGFGVSTPGGSGQPVYRVTNLNDSGAGSLRDALSQGNRMIVFDVAGAINVSDEITISKPSITIDGLSAPSPGITINGFGLIIRGPAASGKDGHDIIISGIRIRNADQDGIWVTDGAYNIVIDHVSVHNSFDGNIDITRVSTKDVTVSYSILAEPAGEEKNMLLAFGSSRMTLHHNILIASEQRNPQVNFDDSDARTKDETNGVPNTTLDFRNNLIWDWHGGLATRIRYGSNANVVNNYYSADGSDGDDALIVCKGSINDSSCYNDPTNLARAYVAGNVNQGGPNINTRGTETSAFTAAAVTTTDAQAAACAAFQNAGVRPLDTIDQQYLSTISLPFCPN